MYICNCKLCVFIYLFIILITITYLCLGWDRFSLSEGGQNLIPSIKKQIQT